ncbi:uncharacterized protein LOC103724312 isoform X2 [Phoenix dactylifera]|uniref:Uncharacterized protein LOC103724312 isoform X2 n=1 Tax=Phoenix dactylifera TaxID=42345 RepID=A0A8B7MXR0_PHODC|nr:uncharacterized protein LOC103724312 isoform X2 [Phoenix dactylifera]
MEQIESEIRRVLQDHYKFSSTVRTEEDKIDALGKEIKALEDRIRTSEAGDLERQRMQNLLSYQSTLIERASSRTELLRALHEDLLLLFIRRKQLRQTGDSGADIIPNVSLSSGLSSGDNNEGLPNDCSRPSSVDIMRMNDDQDNMEEVTTEQAQVPQGLNMPEIRTNKDTGLTKDDSREYNDLRYKSNILDNIAISILDTNTNIDSILSKAMKSSDFPCEEIQDAGLKKVPRKVCRVANCNTVKRLTVDFDEAGNPTGPNAGAFKRSINSYVCHFLPVRFKQISDVPTDDYKSVLSVLMERYNFDINGSYTRKKISSCYRQHKYKLLVRVKKDLERGIEPLKPSYVKQEDWDAFVAKTKDEEFDRISKKNKASRSSVHKRKLGSEEVMHGYVYTKVPKPKRGRKKKVPAVADSSDNVKYVNSMKLHVCQVVLHGEGFNSGSIHVG